MLNLLKQKPKIVKKNIRKLKKMPNMADYEQACKEFSVKKAEKEIIFFPGRKINIAHNAIDRHIGTDIEKKIAFHWIGEDEQRDVTYKELVSETNKFANVLKTVGAKRGDRIFLFLPRIPELYISFLGILKMGGVASTLFAAFGEQALQDRLGDSEAKIIVTSPELYERVKNVKGRLPRLKKIIVTGKDAVSKETISYESEMKKASNKFKTARMKPTDRAYILYTSGTTGKPKGVVHTHYDIVHQHLTTKWILDLKKDDMYWCTADPGWVTGIVYGMIGPFSNGITSIVDARRFDAEKWYKTIDDYKVSVWYTAPTAIRLMMKEGDMIAKKYDLSSLRHICSVGEPLNPEAIWWGIKTIGLCFHDNWWQTETGGILIANYPSVNVKVGSMGKPFPGIKAAIIDENGRKLKPGEEGTLAIKPGWPSMMKEIWKNKSKYAEYFKNGWYVSGDRVKMDTDGYFWFIGRADDVIKTAGHRIGPFEVESALIEHPAIAEAGVIGKPDEMYGEIIKAFISLKKGYQPSDALKEDIQKFIKKKLAGHAYPKEIEFRDNLPKTKSGKIMRRVLKYQELGLPVGDISTIE
jgi:acetyl-CoA synthetase